MPVCARAAALSMLQSKVRTADRFLLVTAGAQLKQSAYNTHTHTLILITFYKIIIIFVFAYCEAKKR